MTKSIMISNDIYEKMCDLLQIPEDERKNVIDMKIHLPLEGAVTYAVEKQVIADIGED
ncbi:conserved hypothetical protein [Vibrio phage 242E40-1]|nr:conserved hypothetical protein [Vibrio phage 242E40-1]